MTTSPQTWTSISTHQKVSPSLSFTPACFPCWRHLCRIRSFSTNRSRCSETFPEFPEAATRNGSTWNILWFQRDMISCLVFGLVLKCNRLCVRALTVCALENEELLVREITRVMHNLNRISATRQMATPILEFLSSNIPVPFLNITTRFIFPVLSESVKYWLFSCSSCAFTQALRQLQRRSVS